MKFTIPGKPQGKGRPRVTRNGTYTPKQTKDYQNMISEIAQLVPNDVVYNMPVKAKIKAFYQIPKSTSLKKRELMECDKIRPIIKPDADNIAKAILDALNGIVYKDDNQVVELVVEKYYHVHGCVVVEIENV